MPPKASGTRTMARLKSLIGPVIILILLAAVSYAIQGFLAKVHYDDVIAAIAETPGHRLALSLGAVALGFLALTGYDW